METLTFGSKEYKEAQAKLLKHLDQAIRELDGAEAVLRTLDDPNVDIMQTKLRVMDTRGRAASTLVYLSKKWRT